MPAHGTDALVCSKGQLRLGQRCQARGKEGTGTAQTPINQLSHPHRAGFKFLARPWSIQTGLCAGD